MRQEKAVVVFDADGVVCDSLSAVLREVEIRTGIVIAPAQVDDWNAIERRIKEITGDQGLAEAMNNLWLDPDVVARSKPHEDGLAFMKALQNDLGLACHLATSRPPSCQQVTHRWLQEHAPWLPQERIHLRTDSDQESGDEFKLKMAEQLNARFFYEDSPSTAQRLREARIRVRVVSRPWNAGFPELNPFRIEDWPTELSKVRLSLFPLG